MKKGAERRTFPAKLPFIYKCNQVRAKHNEFLTEVIQTLSEMESRVYPAEREVNQGC